MGEIFYRVIDFSKCKYYDDLYLMIKQNLELPDSFGHNLAALWDSLTGIMALPAHITMRGTKGLPKDLQWVMEKILTVFYRAEVECKDKISVLVES